MTRWIFPKWLYITNGRRGRPACGPVMMRLRLQMLAPVSIRCSWKRRISSAAVVIASTSEAFARMGVLLVRAEPGVGLTVAGPVRELRLHFDQGVVPALELWPRPLRHHRPSARE